MCNAERSLFPIWAVLYRKRQECPNEDSDDGYDSDHAGRVAYQGEEAFVIEQRVSNLMHSLLLGACMFLAPVLGFLPRAVLWGYFIFTAVEALPGNQCWHRIVLLFIDPNYRRAHHAGERMPLFVDLVPYRHIRNFTLVQVFFIATSYSLTWIEAGGIAFPIVIALTLPARHVLLRKYLKYKYLYELDRHEDVEEVIEREAPEPPELRDDPHHYLTGERLGGHGAFGQVVRTVGERKEGKRALRELEPDESKEDIPACASYTQRTAEGLYEASETSDVDRGATTAGTATATETEEDAFEGSMDDDTLSKAEQDKLSRRMRDVQAHAGGTDEETMTKTEQNKLGAQIRSQLSSAGAGAQDGTTAGAQGEDDPGASISRIELELHTAGAEERGSEAGAGASGQAEEDNDDEGRVTNTGAREDITSQETYDGDDQATETDDRHATRLDAAERGQSGSADR